MVGTLGRLREKTAIPAALDEAFTSSIIDLPARSLILVHNIITKINS